MYTSLYPQALGVEYTSHPEPESVLPARVDKRQYPTVALCVSQLDWRFLPHIFHFLSP